jgi:hypothetical protein
MSSSFDGREEMNNEPAAVAEDSDLELAQVLHNLA